MTQLALYETPKKECRRVAVSVPIPKWLPPSLALWLRQRAAEPVVLPAAVRPEADVPMPVWPLA